MQLKNNMKRPFTGTVRVQSADTKLADGHGGHHLVPKLEAFTIGQGATAEIPDEWWHQLWNVKGKKARDVDVIEDTHYKLTTVDKKPLTIKRKELLSTTSTYPIRDMVKKGLIEIVEKPKPLVSNKDMLEAVNEALGLDFKPRDEEHLIEMYERVVG